MRTLKASLLAVTLLLLNCGKAGTRSDGGASSSASSTSASASASASASSTTAKGKPFVISNEHAIEGAVWLSNGHLMGASHRELFDIDPTSASPEIVRRIPLTRPIQYLVGVRGGSRVITVEEKGLAIWDPIAGKQLRAIPNVSEPVVSPNGTRLAVAACADETFCGHDVYDLTGDTAAGGKSIATIQTPSPSPRKDIAFAGRVFFSDDGRFLHAHAFGSTLIADTSTDTVLVRRSVGRTNDAGEFKDLAVFRGTKVFLTSDKGLEVVELLPSPKVVAHAPDPFVGDSGAVEYAVDPDGRRVVMFSRTNSELFALNVATQKTRSVKITSGSDDPMCPSKLLALADEEASDASAATGATGIACGDDRAPSQRFALVNTPPGSCRILEQAAGHRVVIEHAALCGVNPYTSRSPGFRSDDRFFASIFEGGTHIFDLSAGGKRVAGLGPIPTQKIEKHYALSVIDDVPAIGVAHAPSRTWLTKRSPAPTEPPRPQGSSVVKTTRTHTFGIEKKGDTTRVLVALDRSGKEVLRETPATPFSETIEASENVALLRPFSSAQAAGDKSDFLQCEVGAGCKPVEIGGMIGSFDHPWMVIGPRGGGKPYLLNLATHEKRQLPPNCKNDAYGVKVFRDGTVLCGRCVAGSWMELTRTADGGASTVWIPDYAAGLVQLVTRGGPFLYFEGVVNAGLSPNYRIDIRNNNRVDLFLGPNHAIARFPDDETIERFGDKSASEDALRCLDGDRLLPWSACSATYEVNGKLDR
jgi:hypothetical protein